MEWFKEGYWNEGLCGRIIMYNLLPKGEDVKKKKLKDLYGWKGKTEDFLAE